MTRQGFEMPQRELLTIVGSQLNCWLFINNFEVNIAKGVTDAETTQSNLIQKPKPTLYWEG